MQSLLDSPSVPLNDPAPSPLAVAFTIYKMVNDLYAVSGVADAYDNAALPATSVAPGAGFICTVFGDLLFWDTGFPDVLGDCTVCVAPILVLHLNVPSGGSSRLTVNMAK